MGCGLGSSSLERLDLPHRGLCLPGPVLGIVSHDAVLSRFSSTSSPKDTDASWFRLVSF